jgi:hypothetical protein
MMKWLLGFLIVLLVVLHQDFWNWAAATPLAFGFLPLGLTYHVVFALACAGLMGLWIPAIVIFIYLAVVLYIGIFAFRRGKAPAKTFSSPADRSARSFSSCRSSPPT